ncbi:unnamed protein product [Gongylonema pulchrum]|uniref:ABC transmembrane type-1 domain-containing protein n=1 Tax=Gongylonema pulchrum TaxID=637853 RepID=A0A183DQH0_9BILA|nr:unnamed protein product [Gongylonema pulchrum]
MKRTNKVSDLTFSASQIESDELGQTMVEIPLESKNTEQERSETESQLKNGSGSESNRSGDTDKAKTDEEKAKLIPFWQIGFLQFLLSKMKRTNKVSDLTFSASQIESDELGPTMVEIPLESKSMEQERSETERYYRYAKPLDYFFLLLGILLGVVQGVLQSIQSIIFKHLSDTLVEGQATWNTKFFNETKFHNGAMHAIYMYTGYGTGVLILATVSMSCWHILCERQIHHIRKHYFAAVMRQDMSWFDMSCWHILCERQIHHIRKHYFAAVMRQDMSWFDVHECGELTTRMTDGIDRIRDGIGDKMGTLFTYGAGSVSGIVVAFTCR